MNQTRKKYAVSMAKLGEGLYMSANQFIFTDTLLVSYNSLHDPHLRKYYQRKDVQKLLRERNFVTDENDVICSFKELAEHQRYLEQCKVISERKLAEINRARMMAFMKDKEKGLIGQEKTLADIRETILEEEFQTLKKVMKSEVDRDTKNSQKPLNPDEEEEKREMVLMSWKVMEREQLKRIEREVRCEVNRERLQKEAKERREKQKMATLESKKAYHQMQLMEKVMKSEASVRLERSKAASKASTSKAAGCDITAKKGASVKTAVNVNWNSKATVKTQVAKKSVLLTAV